jgi:hypothetical protein
MRGKPTKAAASDSEHNPYRDSFINITQIVANKLIMSDYFYLKNIL